MPNNLEKKKTHGVPRSEHWPAVRKTFIEKHPNCAICRGKKKLNVHHVKPFHLYPDLELDPNNLITLCENDKGGINCHLAFGHLGSFKSWNAKVRVDAATWSAKIMMRPK